MKHQGGRPDASGCRRDSGGWASCDGRNLSYPPAASIPAIRTVERPLRPHVIQDERTTAMTMCNSNPLGKPEAEHTIIAFDVAKETLAIHVLPDDSAHAIANRPAAVRAFLRRAAVKARTPVLVVCEATGGYERHVVDAAHALGLALHRAHGQRT